MSIHTKLAQQIADEAGAPERAAVNARMIEAQLLAKSFPDKDDFDATARQIEQDTAAKLAPFHAARQSAAEQRLIDVKAATRVLNDEQRVRLAIYLIDAVEGVGEDDRFALNEILGEVQSELRL